MRLDAGRTHVAIPGPSVVPDRVLAAMHRAMPDIYGGELVGIHESVFARLPAIARTAGRPFVAIANGHGGWEMALTNTLSRGDKVLVLESGQFATLWGEAARFDGIEVEFLPARSERYAVDPESVEAHLRADDTRSIRAVLMAHVDTATSVRNDVAAIRAVLNRCDHPALLMVDCIASLGCDRYEMDTWGVDVTIAASQKGLMVPPGLAFVWAGDRAWSAHQQADLRTAYWDWTARASDGPMYLAYNGTPPVSHLFGLDEALTMIDDEGLEHVWARHAALADAVRVAVDAWSAPDGLELNIIDPSARSNAVTTIRSGSIDVERLRSTCATAAGLTLGVGLGPLAGSGFRFGHMGHVNAPMIMGMIGTTEAALHALGAPLGGSGAAAAAASLGRSMSV